eukprot:gnl/TRDRNA2_/TRDRNA2_57695_c0_seq1.p1 gnl/TRDRNA2_/TRDRNA2_57695_c0~~gnl/TRDRNA2_/TRDRNA2_57695_c0_seq1.p1  ORF type:complete len:166 (+),score=8.44 gnl/TRDRNA2_/TRDRNA2_57695_c0_seq1:175-672(+)
MISEFKRLTGRADVPVFGYVEVPSADYRSGSAPYGFQEKFLRDMVSLHSGEASFAAGGSMLWRISDQTRTDVLLRRMISVNLSIPADFSSQAQRNVSTVTGGRRPRILASTLLLMVAHRWMRLGCQVGLVLPYIAKIPLSNRLFFIQVVLALNFLLDVLDAKRSR